MHASSGGGGARGGSEGGGAGGDGDEHHAGSEQQGEVEPVLVGVDTALTQLGGAPLEQEPAPALPCGTQHSSGQPGRLSQGARHNGNTSVSPAMRKLRPNAWPVAP
eukprot:6128626-Prymnesium_polylepis.1